MPALLTSTKGIWSCSFKWANAALHRVVIVYSQHQSPHLPSPRDSAIALAPASLVAVSDHVELFRQGGCNGLPDTT